MGMLLNGLGSTTSRSWGVFNESECIACWSGYCTPKGRMISI